MDRIVGGSLPALIWKTFMEQSDQGNTPTVTAAAGATASQKLASSAELQTASPTHGRLFDQATAAASIATANGSCNVPVCQRDYQSFRASDCTYQPYSGPRQLCRR